MRVAPKQDAPTRLADIQQHAAQKGEILERLFRTSDFAVFRAGLQSQLESQLTAHASAVLATPEAVAQHNMQAGMIRCLRAILQEIAPGPH